MNTKERSSTAYDRILRTRKELIDSNALRETAGGRFRLHAEHKQAGDQPEAISKLISQLENFQTRMILLGVTGSGKTFTMANVIENINRPTLIICHNKTLARQLWQEMSQLFPNNAVEYFVSYYDYYQPEAYLPQRDLYIDKELSKNERIDQERFSTVASLVRRGDTIVVATVSAIYGLNPPETFLQQHIPLEVGHQESPRDVLKSLLGLQYTRTNLDLERGSVRLKGDLLDIWMPSRDEPLRIRFGPNGIERITLCDPIDWSVHDEVNEVWIHPKEFFMTDPERFERALDNIESELKDRIRWFENNGMDLEAIRIRQRTEYDLEMLREIGHCSGVENYSRHFDGREEGEPPYCLLDFMAACSTAFFDDPGGFLVMMDESHVTLPQVGGMYYGDLSRKRNLIDHGFRLPSAYDNRPLRAEEFQASIPRMVYVSATPGERELRGLAEATKCQMPPDLENVHYIKGREEGTRVQEGMNQTIERLDSVVQMIVRPTGLLDPEVEVRPTEGQVQDLLAEIHERVARNERVLVTVLTIKFAEEVSEYLQRVGIKSHHLHSEIDTIERTEIIKSLRHGIIDVIVGINLLREGLDLPEVSLVAIFDADKQGFLRNERSLLQTIGRAARNSSGKAIMYADSISESMEKAIKATLARRTQQDAYNKKHGIIPTTIRKAIPEMEEKKETTHRRRKTRVDLGNFVEDDGGYRGGGPSSQRERAPRWANVARRILMPDQNHSIAELRTVMQRAAENLEFEEAARIRDLIIQLEKKVI